LLDLKLKGKKSAKIPFQTSPLGIESLFQTAALYELIQNSTLALPSKIGALHIHSKKRARYAQIQALARDSTHSYFNAALLDEAGGLIVYLDRLALIHTPLTVNIASSLQLKFSRLREMNLLTPRTSGLRAHSVWIPSIEHRLSEDPQFLETVLTDGEQAGLSRFTHAQRKVAHITGLIAAKAAYFREVGGTPQFLQIEVRKSDQGQPYFYNLSAESRAELYLSISHSDDIATASVSAIPIGIDVERVAAHDPSFFQEAFTPTERQHIGSDPMKGTQFWTAKEAFSKAIGRGLHISLKDIELLPRPEKNHFELTYLGSDEEIHAVTEHIQWMSHVSPDFVLTVCQLPKRHQGASQSFVSKEEI
jgi:phosphopantetheine--protein transferase-like protein